ncbi:hypothetical protein [Streptomyces sp. ME18-1-4]|uniref:hypothetical protein n=1 Tax=Streptomyces sp. ME18-1-4 TaxID=3028685 RepID=UPI0029AF4311|nr:hypothetical protein [Streptomyces sp. ME18-1-4]MDX3242485.1 hypothetical protein [Streptomyces sp. ME18-1-4]
MNSNLLDDWSPADNPYSIALSEANWWRATVALAVKRMHSDDVQVGWFSSRQIDARTLVVALRQLLAAVKLERIALTDLGMDAAVITALDDAEQVFLDTLPNIKHVRDGLTHFEDWARGRGGGPQADARKAADPRDVARDFWSFGYDPVTDTVAMGPFSISVSAAVPAANALCAAIYAATRAVDQRSTAALRDQVVQALTDATISCTPPQGPALVSRGHDMRVWLSLNLSSVPDAEPKELAERVAAVMTHAGLRLTSSAYPQAQDIAARLVAGEPLRVERNSR